jgi:hypothetical protein
MQYLTGSESTLRLIGPEFDGNLAAHAMRPFDDPHDGVHPDRPPLIKP